MYEHQADLPTLNRGEVIRSELKFRLELQKLRLTVQEIRRKYDLRIPEPNLPLLYLMIRAMNPTSPYPINRLKLPKNYSFIKAADIFPSIVISQYGTCGLNDDLNDAYCKTEEGKDIRDSSGRFANERRYNALYDLLDLAMIEDSVIPTESFNEMLAAWDTNTSESQMWQRHNLDVRTALLWSEILTKQTMSEQKHKERIYFGDYSIQNEARRLALSPRAIELAKRGELDVHTPPGVDLADFENKSTIEMLEIIQTHTSEIENYYEMTSLDHENILKAVNSISSKFEGVLAPRAMYLVPVYYGTVGSFSNQHATLINGLTIGGIYNANEKSVQSQMAQAQAMLDSTPFEKRSVFGNILDSYSMMESFYKYPFIIYVRLPTNPKQMDNFSRNELPSLCAEEYLHNCLFVFSSFYKLPHALEEYIVMKMLEVAGLSHSGTPASVAGFGGEIVQQKVDEAITKLGSHPPGITFGAFINEIVDAYYADKK